MSHALPALKNAPFFQTCEVIIPVSYTHLDVYKRQAVTTGEDPRITRVGKFIRRLRLDEFSQLLNFLNGTMSLVGPRPEVRKYVDLYTPEQMATLLVRPLSLIHILRWGNAHATQQELENALRIAQAKDFVDRLPLGLESPVSQGGKNFSGGQKQRLNIARALAGKPEMCISDSLYGVGVPDFPAAGSHIGAVCRVRSAQYDRLERKLAAPLDQPAGLFNVR